MLEGDMLAAYDAVTTGVLAEEIWLMLVSRPELEAEGEGGRAR